MGRRRKPGNEDLPPNLSPAGKWFRYRDPSTGERMFLSMPRSDAKAYAERLNAEGGLHRPESVRAVIARYPVRGSASSRAEKERILRLYRDRWGDFSIRAVTRKTLSAVWDTLDGPHAVQKHRALWIDILRHAIAWGLIKENEAAMTLPPTLPRRKRKRHTVEGYDAIYRAAPDWLQVAMEIAVSSLLRRGDLVALRLSDYDDQVLRTKVRKSEREDADADLLEIVPGPRLRAALSRAKALPVVGDRIVRRAPIRGRRTHVTGDYLSKAFAEVRDRVGVYGDLPAGERPAWHDLRALGIWLYSRRYSIDYAQALADHTDPKMTEHYQAGHEARWQRVEAGL